MAQSMRVQRPDLLKEVQEDIPSAQSGRGAVLWIVIGLLIMTGIFALVLVSIPHLTG